MIDIEATDIRKKRCGIEVRKAERLVYGVTERIRQDASSNFRSIVVEPCPSLVSWLARELLGVYGVV